MNTSSLSDAETELLSQFGCLILTHGRARDVRTYKTLRRQGYTGPIYLVIDDEDDQAYEYYRLYGESVVMFEKSKEPCDQGDNLPERRAILYARNATFRIAAQKGLRYYLQLDDDYHRFSYKFGADYSFQERKVKNLDRLFATVLTYYASIPAASIALGQTGDYIGGGDNIKFRTELPVGRKAMNTFFCSSDRPFKFCGKVNEDVTTYISEGSRGLLFLTCFNATIHQCRSQSKPGGMSGLYLDQGTYWKSFYSVMFSPSAVWVSDMGATDRRIHHEVSWDHAVPKIVAEKYRKPA